MRPLLPAQRALLAQLHLLTQEEEDAGFRKYRVHDPEAALRDREGLTLVVGYKVSSSDLIWKVTDGAIAYKHRRFGTRSDRHHKGAAWEPIGMGTFDSPEAAVQRWQFEDPGRVAYEIYPVDFIHKEFSD